MRVRQVAGPAEFLAATADLRAADPVRTNVLGTVAQSVVDGRRYERETWLVAEDDGRVVGAAVWTLPHKLVLGPTTPEVAQAIAAAATATGVPVTGASVPADLVDAVAAGVGVPGRVAMRERILVLDRFLAPRAVPGVARLLTEADVDEAVPWMDAFTTEAGVLAVDNQVAVRSSLGRLRYWEVDGERVAMAGHAPLVMTPGGVVGRIGPVFTPRRHRGRGYGSAVTAAVVEDLLPRTDTVMLYTDAANATSNGVYERLGFVHVADVVDLDLVTG